LRFENLAQSDGFGTRRRAGGPYCDHKSKENSTVLAGCWCDEAVALAPDLPAAYDSCAVALARHGDLAGARTRRKDAHPRRSHWADPRKAWGEELLKLGRDDEAPEKYDEAVKYAPNWAALRELRDATAKKRH
jgi:hypothetical protein